MSDHDKLMELLFVEDPMGLSKYEQRDEYDLEARMILPKIAQLKGVADIQRAVYDTFKLTFAPLAVGDLDHYYHTAVAIWVDRIGLDKEIQQ